MAGFDSKGFLKAQFVPRTEEVPVPALSDWFEDCEPVWQIRGLTGHEFARVQEAARKATATVDIAAALATAAGSKEKIDGIMQAAGLPADIKKTPEELVRRLEMLVTGSVEPAISMDVAVKFATAFPIEFHDLTNRILVLTGQGHVVGKHKPSGDSPE
ncbi:MAG: hypothetical protein RBR77_04170 [Thauera sp.]|jgi:hypothetical protein|nr:hypothetical protein [Thauera sp.]